MAEYATPKKGVEYITYVALRSQANAQIMQSNPTIAAGDFQVSIDGGALANLATLPAVTPASSKMVKITLSTSEMNGDNVTVVCSDASGSEWADLVFNIQTSVRGNDDLAFPTTSGRSIDVTAGGTVGIDWANVEAPTTTVTLSGTTVKTATDVETDTADIQSRLPAALVSGRIDASVGAMATDVITSTALAASAVTEIQSGLSTLDAAGIRTAVGLASANLDTQLDALPTAAENADAVWDEDATAHQTQGTFGQAIGDPGADADSIWALANTNLDATVSSRLASASYTAPLDAAGTATAVWNAATATYGSAGSYGLLIETNLDAASSTLATAANLATVAGYLDTEIAAILADTNELQVDWVDGGRLDLLIDAIKAKTDNLPASPAAVGSAMTLTSAYDFAKGTTAMTESYPVLGATMTPVQALYSINQVLNENSVSGTTMTVKKRDQSTTAKTFTLNDATSPTAITEAS